MTIPYFRTWFLCAYSLTGVVCCVQGVEESSISIGLDDSVRIDLAVVGCVAVSLKGPPHHCAGVFMLVRPVLCV